MNRKRLRVVIQQQVLPPYRVPFFEALGKHVDLTVCIALNSSIPGVETVPNDRDHRHFRVEAFQEGVYLGRRFQRGAIDYALSEKADVLVAGAGYLQYLAWALRELRRLRRANVKIMTWGCEGYEFDDESQWRSYMSGSLLRRIHFVYLGMVYRRVVSAAVAYSRHTVDFWRYAYKIPENRLFVAENAVDTKYAEQEYRSVLRGDRTRKQDQVVFVGRLIPSKRIDLLIRAFAKVLQRAPQAMLVIVGDGPARSDLVRLVSEIGIDAGRVEFGGHISDKKEIARILASSGVFVLPGYGGLALNEAMAAGLAIVCSRGDGTERHLVGQGENGLFVRREDEESLVDAMLMLLTDTALIQRMGEASFARITQKFTLENMVSGYIRAIESCFA